MTGDTLLHRQVNPSWVQQGRVTSQAFRPTPKDQRKLSVYDGDQVSAEKAWEHFTTVMKFSSVGVMAVSFDECRSEDLTVVPDPVPHPAHCLIDFSAHSENDKRIAKRLKAFAESRGWQFRG